MRQVVLDTETTGLEPSEGHRIIEIGCVELVNRRPTGRHFHEYIHPDRDIDPGAAKVHGITLESLAGKPRFHQVHARLMEFIDGAELVIHNAPFDVAFLDAEFARCVAAGGECITIRARCRVLDTLALAREMHPGQRNGLDALCKRYFIDNSHRTLHGALLDARILADVYLAMTGGQSALALDELVRAVPGEVLATAVRKVSAGVPLQVVVASPAESAAHDALMQRVHKASGGKVLWQ